MEVETDSWLPGVQEGLGLGGGQWAIQGQHEGSL